MVDRARANPKIIFKTNKAVEDMLGENGVTGIKLKDTVTGAIEEIALEGIFVAIGHTPNTKLFAEYLKLDPKGYIITNTDKSQVTGTGIDGVFACGDVQDTRYRQAITAAGSGCAAALDAEHYLSQH